MHQRHKVVVACIILVTFTNAWGQQAYSILLHRKVMQGDHIFAETVAGQNSVISTKWDGLPTPTKTESTSVIRCVADDTFLEVDESGHTIKEQYKISSLTQLRDDGKGEIELVPSQSVIVAEGGETETTFTIDGKPVDRNLKVALSRFISLNKIGRLYNMDQLWGTDEAKRIGDRWIGNSKLALEQMLKRGSMTTEDKPSVESELVAIGAYDDVPCIKVHLSSELKEFKPTKASPGLSLNHASTMLDITGWFPQDANKIAPRLIRSTKDRYVYEGMSEGRRFTSEQIVTAELQFRMLRKLP